MRNLSYVPDIKARILNDVAGYVRHHQKTGTFEVRRSYLSCNGFYLDDLIQKIKEAFPSAVIVRARDVFRTQPKESCLVVEFKIPDPGAMREPVKML